MPMTFFLFQSDSLGSLNKSFLTPGGWLEEKMRAFKGFGME